MTKRGRLPAQKSVRQPVGQQKGQRARKQQATPGPAQSTTFRTTDSAVPAERQSLVVCQLVIGGGCLAERDLQGRIRASTVRLQSHRWCSRRPATVSGGPSMCPAAPSPLRSRRCRCPEDRHAAELTARARPASANAPGSGATGRESAPRTDTRRRTGASGRMFAGKRRTVRKHSVKGPDPVAADIKRLLMVFRVS